MSCHSLCVRCLSCRCEAWSRPTGQAAADGRLLWPNRDVCVRIGGKGSRGDGERTDGASDGFVRFLELMRVRSLCDDVDSVGVGCCLHTRFLVRKWIAQFPSQFPLRRLCCVQEIQLVEAVRRKGLGTAMITEAKRWAAENSVSKVRLNCAASNPALPFYYRRVEICGERLGTRSVHTRAVLFLLATFADLMLQTCTNEGKRIESNFSFRFTPLCSKTSNA